MKANELRIGNLIMCNNELVSISDIGLLGNGFGINMTHTCEYKYLSNEDKIEPIPLTDEWLIKLGFDKDEVYNCIVIYQNDIISLDLEFSCNSKTISIGGYSCADEMDNCKYIHQLQNLYYALTGNELVLSGI